ncbi:MAG: endonuclease/exonuclease/phosphatase family protein [Propionibacteriaceae bacterium]|nr:endonuclease/exonuclease/phosphatase family protein [Propionibacteriaceae bacterium]
MSRRSDEGRRSHPFWLALGWVGCLSTGLVLASSMFPVLQGKHVVFALAASFTPHALLGWLFAVLVFIVAAKGKAKLLALIAAIGLACNLLVVEPYLPRPTRLEAQTPQLRVLTVNLCYGQADVERFVELFHQVTPDVVVLAEITTSFAEAFTKSVKKELPHRAGTPSAEGMASGTMIFSRFPLTEADAAQTTFNSAFVEVADPGGKFILGGVHTVNPVRDFDLWLADGEAIAEVAARRVGRPLIIAGDFNATDEHLPLRKITSAGLSSVERRVGAGWIPTFPSDIGLVPPLIGIDHILINKEFRATKVYAVSVVGTDHLGLVAELVRT